MKLTSPEKETSSTTISELSEMMTKLKSLDKTAKARFLNELFEHANLAPELIPKLKELSSKQKQSVVLQIIDSFAE
jgi:transcriptional regulator NrdR family protein